MRNLEIKLSEICASRYEEIAERLRYRGSALMYNRYFLIKDPLRIYSSIALINTFFSQRDDIRVMWTRCDSISNQRRQFNERKDETEFYEQLFLSALEYGVFIVEYRGNDDPDGIKSHIEEVFHDDFEFRLIGGELTLAKFIIYGGNIHKYKLMHKITRTSPLTRLIGILDVD